MKYLLSLLLRPFVSLSTLTGNLPFLIISTCTGVALSSYFGGLLKEAFYWSLIVVLFVIIDLFCGLEAAKLRKERVTPSNAARRTASKVIGYFFWVFAFCCWGKQADNEMYARIGCGLAAGVEALSAVGNYLEIHGYAISIKGFLKMIGNKFGLKGLEGAIVKDEKTQRGCGGIEYVNNDSETIKND